MFNRRQDATAQGSDVDHLQKSDHGDTGEKFRFGSWIRLHGVDIITMAGMGALGLGVYMAPPAPSRSFPIYFEDGEVVYPEFAYPLRKEVIPIFAAALIAFFVPFFFFVLFQARQRSMNHLLNTTMGLLRGLITAAVFQVFIKWLIGGLRPHFLAVCQPSVGPGVPKGNGFGSIMYDRTICTGDVKKINDALESFPSGHSSAGSSGLIYLALYFNAQLKVMSAHSPAFWKMILFFAPILGTILIAGALTIDNYHNWYDVVAGCMIGTAHAIVAFRMTFASVWDFRFNHILLPRTTSLFHRKPVLQGTAGPFFTYQPSESLGSHEPELPFTREGGWGWGQEASVGAPFDASALGRGTGRAVVGAGGAIGRAEAGLAGNHGQGTHDPAYGMNETTHGTNRNAAV